MNDHLVKIYLNQVRQECERCFHSLNMMNRILANEVEDDFFLYALDLIHHAAAVSRIFWPPASRNKKSTKRAHRRGQALRDMLFLESGHPVQNRSLRDHFEHFDERLDDWAESSRNRNIVFRLLGPATLIGGDAIDSRDIIYHYDPAIKIFGFRGEHFDIQALASGLSDIYAKTNEKLSQLENRRFFGA